MPRGRPPGVRRSAVDAQVPEQKPASVLEHQPASRRADETRRERRRRDDGDLDRMASMKLAIPRDKQEQAQREGKVLRWIMDGRMADAHSNDWDRVDGVEPIQANPMSGTDERLVLCSKYADWHDTDLRRDERTIDEREQRALSGHIDDQGGSSAGLVVPKGQTNRVTTQRGL